MKATQMLIASAIVAAVAIPFSIERLKTEECIHARAAAPTQQAFDAMLAASDLYASAKNRIADQQDCILDLEKAMRRGIRSPTEVRSAACAAISKPLSSQLTQAH